MKKLLTLTSVAITAVIGTSCVQNADNSEAPDQPDAKCLVLYYSQTGTTKAVAEALQQELGADIEAIKIEIPYDGDYGQTVQRVGEEKASGIVPKTLPIEHNPADYDVIFLGYPIWYGTYAPPIAGFIQANDLNDTKIVPFCTFGSGGLETSIDDLTANLPNAEIANGYGVRTARIESMPAELHRFLIHNGYIHGECQPLEDFTAQRPVTTDEAGIFQVSTKDYMFPLGTPVTCGHRTGYDGTEYMFVAKSVSPNGEESYSSVFVNAPADTTQTPVFTRVVR